ncbi:hypothetical protein PG994_008467 [Apiospora phragmitis]|uniref:Secreted protein n=1 Tax=Apiospora phragmitis TaxID=2905665 RepID=A0ABR1UGJ6_9PEZI
MVNLLAAVLALRLLLRAIRMLLVREVGPEVQVVPLRDLLGLGLGLVVVVLDDSAHAKNRQQLLLLLLLLGLLLGLLLLLLSRNSLALRLLDMLALRLLDMLALLLLVRGRCQQGRGGCDEEEGENG